MKLLDRLFAVRRHGAPDRVHALPRRVRKAVLPSPDWERHFSLDQGVAEGDAADRRSAADPVRG